MLFNSWQTFSFPKGIYCPGPAQPPGTIHCHPAPSSWTWRSRSQGHWAFLGHEAHNAGHPSHGPYWCQLERPRPAGQELLLWHRGRKGGADSLQGLLPGGMPLWVLSLEGLQGVWMCTLGLPSPWGKCDHVWPHWRHVLQGPDGHRGTGMLAHFMWQKMLGTQMGSFF